MKLSCLLEVRVKVGEDEREAVLLLHRALTFEETLLLLGTVSRMMILLLRFNNATEQIENTLLKLSHLVPISIKIVLAE